ncbi:MAG TPA: hypothetical protein VG944_05945 [Fimbriimonas sp.]|nr:hypothetical protein [Fimbriimonas sp.]
MNGRFPKPARLLLGFIVIYCCQAATAQGPLAINVAPTRVTFDKSSLSSTVTIVNRGLEPVRYRLNLCDMEMAEDGTLTRKLEPTRNSAQSYIRFAPREVALGPGEIQKVRILATIPACLPKGEYRSHLAFEPISTGEAVSPSLVKGGGAPGKLKLQMRMRAAVTIPIFLRNGDLSGKGSVSDIAIVEGKMVRVTLSREGDRTVRGNCLVKFIPAGGKTAVLLAKGQDVPVYFPNQARSILFGMEKPIAGFGAGSLEVSFFEPGGPVSTKVVPVSGS